MFDQLGEKLEGVFRKLRGEVRLSEDNIKAAVREVRMALLEADVSFKVVKDFVAAVREQAVGAEVLKSVRPGQQFIKIVHDELVAMMGGRVEPLKIQKGQLNSILLLGLQGSGKTTFSGKFALFCKKQGFNPILVACDVHRPAAVEQLKVVGQGVGVPVFEMGAGRPAPKIAQAGLAEAKRQGCDLAIFDTAGRLHIDEVRMEELESLKKVVQPRHSLLVVDAMTGQDAVHSAERFNEDIGIDGVCLTKLDGDARGGAALSIRAVTGRPIYFAGIGERSEDLEAFHPDRMASRILGMGDVLTLVEKAQEDFDQDEAEAMQKKLKREQFSLQDFLDQLTRVKKMGSLKNLMGMIPGLGAQMKDMDIDDDDFKPMEALILSMTPAEREHPEILTGSRRKRIAKGSGRDVAELNGLLKEFQSMRKMMSQVMRMGGGGGGMGGLAKLFGGGMPGGAGPTGGAVNQKRAAAGDSMGQKMKPKHRRKRKTKKTQKRR